MYISIPLAIAVVFGMFKLFVPHKERKDIDEALLVKNKRKYALYELLSIFPLCLFMGSLIYLVYKTGNVLADILAINDDSKFWFVTDSISWTMPGVILGFGLVIIPMEHLYQFILKDEYKLYLEAANRRHGWDSMKVMKPISKFLIFVGAISFILLLNVSVRVTDQSIFINNFFSFLETEIHLDEIDEIAYYDSKIAPNGNLVDNEQIVFYSNGVEIWSTEIAFLNDKPERFDPMIQFILNRNQLKIREKGLYDQ